jgi:hypothetical protein
VFSGTAWRWRAALLLVASSVTGLGASSVASADPLPACAAAPYPYTGSDATAAGLNQLDTDEDLNCVALEQTMDGEASGLHSDLWLIAGVIVGTFVMGEVLRKVFP